MAHHRQRIHNKRRIGDLKQFRAFVEMLFIKSRKNFIVFIFHLILVLLNLYFLMSF